ncbi:serine hydrolase domain-containing protein [Nesterenkonia ebinurensis]|uniref:serine hydrolase domain-containing protein n=1 Tax=Nesterenkonia ebinurensis TaxID=2608252 RepID=UPI00123DBAA5|nr:serine hydrolase domain-containing protein [Nesterenkonia ebinurensis]
MADTGKHFTPALERIGQLAAEDSFSGVVFIRQGAHLVADQAYGLATRRWSVPVQTSTRFDIASITKLFTSVAVLQLVDAGSLTLDERIHSRVDLTGTRIPEDVTLHHLLNHTSGIADDADEEAGESYEALWADRPTYSVTETKGFLPQFVHKEPVFPAGTDCRYNNAGYILLGLALENLTGRSYHDVIRQEVFARAGMVSSDFFNMRQAVPDVAEGWDPVTDDGKITGWRQNIFSYPPIGSPADGAHATAGDLVRFLDAVESGRLLSEESTARFLSSQALHHKTKESESPTSTHELHHAYGLEIEYDAAARVRSYYKDGINTGASGILRKYPRLDLTVVVLSTSEDGAWEPIDLIDQAAAELL